MAILGRVTALAWRYRWRLLAAYFSLLASTVFTLAVPRLVGEAIDRALASGQLRVLLILALGIIAVSTLRGLFAYLQTYLGEWISQRVAYDLRNAVYDKLQRLSFAYHDREQTGNLMSKATADVEAVRMFIQVGFLRTVQLALMAGGTAALLLSLNWRLALIGLAFVPFLAWRAAVVSRALRSLWLHIQSVTGIMTTVLQENLTGVRVVRAFGAEEFERHKFDTHSGEVARASSSAMRLQAVNTSQAALALTAATGLLLWFGGREVLQGSLTVGQLAQFVLYLGLLAMPVRMSGWVISSFSRASSAGERIYAVLDARSPVQEKQGSIKLGHVRGHLRFEDVSFSYNDTAPALKHIGFEAPPGRRVALLGAPGSGKTTIAHLIPRFYDVTSGRITLDDVDIRDVVLTSLRQNVGVVMQDVFLFTATIRENIAYGKPKATSQEIERAAKLAQLHDFITSLPQGYDTWVGERGITLSGGQRQRLAIARTLLLDPPVLILDDATSSVDAQTEHLLRQALEVVMKGRTTIIIAHRLSTVRNADLTLVLQDGEVVERGTHQELLARGGLYQQIYELQLRPQEQPALSATPGGGDGHWPGQAITQVEAQEGRR